jgi:hypothetical protein
MFVRHCCTGTSIDSQCAVGMHDDFVVADRNDVQITGKLMKRCLPGKWLSNDVIDFVLGVWMEAHQQVLFGVTLTLHPKP